MKRTYILSVLVLICAAYIFRTKYGRHRTGLESAKEKIENIASQPSARTRRDRTQGSVAPGGSGATAADQQAEASREESGPFAAPGDDDKVTRLTKGTFTVVDGTIVYGPDAELDIGHGRVVSSPTGVMVSDADQRHIAGDLVIEGPEGTTTAENAFITVDRSHMELTSDSATTVKK
jgi:hypothetical protein